MDAAARRTAGRARWTAVIAVIVGYALPLLMPALSGLIQPFALVAAVKCLGVARDRGTRLITAICVVLVAIPLIVQGVSGLSAASLDERFEQPATPVG